jgi:putative membrane protein
VSLKVSHNLCYIGANFSYLLCYQHFLRAEPGIYYADLYPLICFLPRYAVQPPAVPTKDDLLPLWNDTVEGDSVFDNPTGVTSARSGRSTTTLSDPNNGEKTSDGTAPRRAPPRRQKTFDPEQVLPVFVSDQPLGPARNPPEPTFWDYFGFLRIFRPVVRLIRGRKTGDLTVSGRKKKKMDVESNVPLEITLFLSSYLAWLLRNGLLQPAIATGMVTNISSLQDTFNNLERIRNTPLPFAYQAHLRISLWCV